jgi:hypothetical protein
MNEGKITNKRMEGWSNTWMEEGHRTEKKKGKNKRIKEG